MGMNYAATIADLARQAAPTATKKQIEKLVAAAEAKKGYALTCKNSAVGIIEGFDDEIIVAEMKSLMATDASLVPPLPTVPQLVNAIAADREARGLPVDGMVRAELARELEQITDPDELLARIPAGAAFDEKPAQKTAEPVPVQKVAAPIDWSRASQREIDLEIERCFPVSVRELSFLDRQRYSDAIRARSRTIPTPASDEIAVKAKLGTNDNTDPMQRIAAYREQQAAHAAANKRK
ncbi:MAG: hypothetical protein JSS20_18735 [Proteobacteria bacterium]|nr:hypothetical protein [Pseudomonadota bacterium]